MVEATLDYQLLQHPDYVPMRANSCGVGAGGVYDRQHAEIGHPEHHTHSIEIALGTL